MERPEIQKAISEVSESFKAFFSGEGLEPMAIAANKHGGYTWEAWRCDGPITHYLQVGLIEELLHEEDEESTEIQLILELSIGADTTRRFTNRVIASWAYAPGEGQIPPERLAWAWKQSVALTEADLSDAYSFPHAGLPGVSGRREA